MGFAAAVLSTNGMCNLSLTEPGEGGTPFLLFANLLHLELSELHFGHPME